VYCVAEMIDMGLEEGQQWPNDSYRQVASYVLLNNPHINTRDQLREGTQRILTIPGDRIQKVTLINLEEFGFRVGTSGIKIVGNRVIIRRT
jgi:hypothetical protein